jgi:L-aminopeptidase/D-esterase-like protein
LKSTANLADADCRIAFTPDMLRMRIKGGPSATSVENTTLAVVVTDAALTKPRPSDSP